MSNSQAIGAVVGAAVCLATSPYLARLTLTVPDREDARWWRGRAASRARLGVTAGVALALGVLAGLAAGWSALLPALVVLALAGAPLVVIDYEHHRLPDRLVRVAAAGGIVGLSLTAAVQHDWHSYLRSIEGGAAAFAVLFVLAFIAPRSFGYGDVKLGGALGVYLGWFGWLYVYYGIFAGFVLGSLVAIAMIATSRATLKTAVAFGPMLIVGALLVMALSLAPSMS